VGRIVKGIGGDGALEGALEGKVKAEVDGDTDAGLHLIDLPGTYSLELAQSEAEICRDVLAGTLATPGHEARAPDAVLVVIDSGNLERNLLIVLRRRLPTVVALNMIDLTRKRGHLPDASRLATLLGCDVIPSSGRKGEGIAQLVRALHKAKVPNVTPPGTQEGLESWAHRTLVTLSRQEQGANTGVGATPSAGMAVDSATDRADRILTHPVLGLAVFALVMFALFYAIFRIAEIPMGLIEAIFGRATDIVKDAMPPGILADFLGDGVIAGIGGTLVFLPQICLLFFLISLLEDTGYLSRAAFLADRFLRPFGLSGNAFVPLLSCHACAIPGLMATRAIPDRKERLAAILVAPFMSCSARIPVYVLLTSVLFPGKAGTQALAFMGCYALGAGAGLLSALVARRTLLKGTGRPMAMELPTYKLPSLRSAALTTWDRALAFLKKAGTMILAISIVLWWLSSYPKVDAPAEVAEMRAQAQRVLADKTPIVASGTYPALLSDDSIRANNSKNLERAADQLEASHAAANSFLGRIGQTVQPIFAPLGYDWKLSVGVMASFAAREVFASTMAIITTGSDDAEEEGVIAGIASSTRDDGKTLIFTPAVAWSLLVYFVLAMQCLPTLAVTAKESGSVKWALVQLVWMCGVAYVGAMLVYQIMR